MYDSNRIHENRARSPLLWMTLASWVAITVFAGWHLVQSIAWPSSPIPWLGLSLFLSALLALWLVLAHMLSCAILKASVEQSVTVGSCDLNTNEIPIALLLCTRDDWKGSAAISCIRAMRTIDHLYICDDSESAEYQNFVNIFHVDHPGRCTIVRRGNLKGWKAGNLNNCLHQAIKSHPYFMVVDHDNIIESTTIERALAQIVASPDIGFVQFPNEDDSLSTTHFARDLRTSISAIWWFLSLRARHGFAFTVGHAVLFRSDAVERIGGFPEKTLTEDFGITMKLRNNGYRGVYNLSISSKESIPETYGKYRARYIRWCTGTVQCWLDSNIRLHLSTETAPEAFDALLLSMNLLYSFLLFGLISGLWLTSGDVAKSIALAGPFFKVTTVLALLSPNLPILFTIRRPTELFRAVAVNTAVYLSMIVPTVVAVTASILLRHSSFVNTGNKLTRETWNLKKPPLEHFSANGLGTLAVELLLFLALLSNVTKIGLFGTPLLIAVFCGPVFSLVKWNSWIVTLVKYLPLVSILLSSFWFFVAND